MKLLDVVHPAAKTLVEIAKSQDAEVCSCLQQILYHIGMRVTTSDVLFLPRDAL